MQKCVGKRQTIVISDRLLDVLNSSLRSQGVNEVQGSRISTVQSLKLKGHCIQSRLSSPTSRNSYTVEFDNSGQLCYGFVEVFVQHASNYYAIIQEVEVEVWSDCRPQDDLSDILSTYGNLQSLIGNDFMPGHESDNFTAVEVEQITDKVVCVKMNGSTCLFLARVPNIIECD